jgi:hypothetical protein
MVSVVGVTLYEALKDPEPLAGPQLEEPVRVALTATVAVRTVVVSLSVPMLPVVCGPSTSMLQTPLTEIVHVKPLSRLNVPDVAAPLAISVMLPEQLTVAVRMPPMLQLPWKLTVSEMLAAAGLLVVPTAVPVSHVTVATP